MPQYIPIPVEAAKTVALTYHKSQVVIIGFDPVHDGFHTATYGVEARDKIIAARMGEILTNHAGGDVSDAEFTEDFRQHYDAALMREAIELLHAALPCVEESEEFNKPTHRGLSQKIKALVAKSGVK